MIKTGLTVLIIGSSHLAAPGSLITHLSDGFLKDGAKHVHAIGVCGSTPSWWTQSTRGTCGGAERLDNGPIKLSFNTAATTTPINDLIKADRPDLVIVVMGDTLANYAKPEMSQSWAAAEVYQLTKAIKKTNTRCIWVGPTWGIEGGSSSHKDNTRVQEVARFLASHTKPCVYLNSLDMAKKGEWKTTDGTHLSDQGYKSWANAIFKVIK